MFKAVDKNKRITKEFFKKENSNFKGGSIVMSTQSILTQSINKINDIGGLPMEGNQHIIITRKAINSFDFILAILNTEVIHNLIIAFYRIGKKTAIELNELQKQGRIKSIIFLINDGFPKLVPQAWNVIKSFESKNWEVKLENNHTKIILAETKNNNYVIEGSGNLSINARIEQYRFDNNKKILDFHKNWITKI